MILNREDEIAVGGVIIRLHFHGPPVTFDRFIQPAGVFEAVAEVAVGGMKIRLHFDGLL